jgi:hypothetical protein
VAAEGIKIVYGRVHPPPEFADASRVPGVLAVVGSEGLLGFATDVSIAEEDDPRLGRPRHLAIHARGSSLDLKMDMEVHEVIRSPSPHGSRARREREPLDFLQLRGIFHVSGRAGERSIELTAAGAAETFREGASSAPR